MVTRAWGEFVFAPPSARHGEVIVPEREEAHHLFRVRRVSPGDEVFATDGEGMVFCCAVTAERTLRIVESFQEFGELSQPLVLCLAALQPEALRDAVDTATQLGATRILVFIAERSQSRLTAERVERLRRVAISAVKQCGRARLPELVWTESLNEALRQLPSDCSVFVAHPVEERQPFAGEHESRSQALIIGPEGGLADEEIEAALQVGAVPISLGNRRLRSATAVAAGLAFLLTRLEECG
jgi:16S rRNA (uracil1498-N3)-methyltransferase